jgi:hypothetical protein
MLSNIDRTTKQIAFDVQNIGVANLIAKWPEKRMINSLCLARQGKWCNDINKINKLSISIHFYIRC